MFITLYTLYLKFYMKILAADLPEYFPGPPFFMKMVLADKFVIANDFQFSTRSNINRAKIKTADGVQWLTVPVFSKGKGSQIIKDVRTVTDSLWQHKQWRTIQSSYKYAPYFDYYADILKEMYKQKWEFLLNLNVHTIEFIQKTLRIDKSLNFSSEVNSKQKGTENIINIVKFFQCDHYLIFEQELKYVDQKKLENESIQLIVKKYTEQKYFQQFSPFTSDLSVLDLILNTGPESIKILKTAITG